MKKVQESSQYPPPQRLLG